MPSPSDYAEWFCLSCALQQITFCFIAHVSVYLKYHLKFLGLNKSQVSKEVLDKATVFCVVVDSVLETCVV